MHRLCRAARCSQSATKIIQLCSNNIQRGPDRRGHGPSHTMKRATSLDSSINPTLFASYWSLAFNNPCQGGLGTRMFSKYSSQFHIHPEKLKQIIKEKYGQNLCVYYDSDTYKQKAVEVVEQQSRVINEGTPMNLNDSDITYEHMINCAQPRQKPKVFVVKKKMELPEDPAVTKQKKIIRKVISPNILKKKKDVKSNRGLPVAEPQIVYSHDSSEKKEGMNIKDCRRKYRKRTTILPIYLKRIQENLARKEKAIQSPNSPDLSAQKFYEPNKINYETQLLNTRKYIYITKSKYKGDKKAKTEESQHQLKEKETNADYENEVSTDINKKYAVRDDPDRSFLQSTNMGKKFVIRDGVNINQNV